MKNRLLILLIAFIFAGCGDATAQCDYSDSDRCYTYSGTYTYTGRSVAVNTGSNSNTKIINDEWCGNSSWSGTVQYDRYEVYYTGGFLDLDMWERQESDKWVVSGTNPTNNANAFQGSNNTAFYFEHSNGDIAGVEIFQTNGVATSKQSDTRYLVDCNAETYGNQYTMYPTWTTAVPDCGDNYFYDGETNYNNGFFSPSHSEGNYYFNFWHTGTEAFPKIGDRIYSKKNSDGGNPIPFTLSNDLWWVIPVDDSASSGQGYPLYIQVDSDGYVTDQVDGLLCGYENFQASYIPSDTPPPNCSVPTDLVQPMLVRTSNQWGNYTGVVVGSGVRKSPNMTPYGTYPPINGGNKWYLIAQGLSIKVNSSGTVTSIDRDSGCNAPIDTDPVTKECTYNLGLVSPNSLISLGYIFNQNPPVSLTEMATIAGVTLPASFPTDFNKSWGNVILQSTSTGTGITVNSCNDVSVAKDASGMLNVKITGATFEARDNMKVSTPESGWIKFKERHYSPTYHSFDYTFSPNTSVYSRQGTILFTLGNETLSVNVTQAAGDYSFSASPSPLNIGSSGGSGKITVTTGANWKAETNDAWILLNPNEPEEPLLYNQGNGVVQYNITERTSTSGRTGTITFEIIGFPSETLTVNQDGAPVPITMYPVELIKGSTQTGACTGSFYTTFYIDDPDFENATTIWLTSEGPAAGQGYYSTRDRSVVRYFSGNNLGSVNSCL